VEGYEFTAREGEPVWCGVCSGNIASALRSMPYDAALVVCEMDYGTPAGRERVSGTRGRPLHGKEGLARLIEEIHGVLTGWEDDTRQRRGYSPRKTRRQGVQIEYSTNFLVGQLGWILEKHPYREATTAFGWEVTGLHRKVRKVTKDSDLSAAPQRCVGVRCPRCAWKALVREIDESRQPTGYYACENCGRLLTGEEYRTAVTASLKAVR
jgi:predicted RNA-binding Zn-ribbon protein involved in translation (DUF1610 family)